MEHVAIMGDVINAYRNSDGKYEGNPHLGRQMYRTEDNIKIDKFWNHHPFVYIRDYFNLCQSKHNTFNMHCLFSVQHVSAEYASHHHVEVTTS
jgi:hypothetical protein